MSLRDSAARDSVTRDSALRDSAAQESATDDAGERKRLRSVASDLQGALPLMLRALEGAIASSEQARISDVLSHLSNVAATQPRLFKSVLAVVTDGLGQLASGELLQPDQRIACVELLITL